MRPDRIRRRVATACLPLAAAGLLAAGGDDDASSRSARAPGTGSPNAIVPGAPTTSPRSCASSLGRRADSAAITAPPATAAATSTTPRASDEKSLARPFAAGSPWNTPVDTLAIDRRSRRWVQRASRRLAVVASRNQAGVDTTERRAKDLRLYVNTCAWTPAIVGEGEGRPVRVVCRQRNCGPVAKAVHSLRIADDVAPLPEFDGWFSVIDESAGVGYDMWRARRVGAVISYQFIKRWLLDGPGFSPPATRDPVGAVGARGSGLPLFAGVIQPSELRQGRIEHALAISVPGPAQRIFVAPASVTNGVNALQSLPEGARLRLKSSFRLGKLTPGANRRSAEAIVSALRTYGAIVVDRSITPTLYAARGDYGTLLLGNELQGIELGDLDVVQTGSLLRYPPLESTFEAVQG